MPEPNLEATPETILDELRDRADLTPSDRDDRLNRLVQRFAPRRLVDCVRQRLGDLGSPEAEVLLRLVEAYGDEPLYEALAAALEAQPGLAPERAWEALSILDAAGMLDRFPALSERWDDLNEAIDEESSLADLARQVEEDADGSWLALQGLAAVESEVRAEIIAGLADQPGGPGLVEFLRLLAFAHDPATRWAALDALDERPTDDPSVQEAWRSIASTHPDPDVADRARARVEDVGGSTTLAVRPAPDVVRSLVTAVDGEGRATIVLATRDGGRWAGAAFLCHGLRGIVDVVGQDGIDATGLDDAFHALNEQTRCDVLEGVPDLATGLLAVSLKLCGPTTTPALRYWIERTAGRAFRPGSTAQLLGDWDPAALSFDEIGARAREVVRACPLWADHSEVASDLGREIALREEGNLPDPRRDAGAFRFLFEHRLAARVDLYQRMLLWMAAFWRGAGEERLGRSALALAWQLADPQHDVPSHPFFVELTSLSFEVAARP